LLPAASWHPSYAWQQFASFALIAASAQGVVLQPFVFSAWIAL
jgi:hypothetical protein